jgi:hypothetical protein
VSAKAIRGRGFCEPMREDFSQHPASMYLRLAEGPDDLIDERRSSWHRAFAIFAIVVYLTIGFLLASGLFSPGWAPWKPGPAIASSGPGEDGHGGDDDDDGDDEPNTDANTGRETVGNSDAGGQDTGGSTAGETDPGDHTGKTERR